MKILNKAILTALGTAAMAGLSSQAMAVGITGNLTSIINNPLGTNTTARPAYVWDGGNIGYGASGAGDCVTNGCGNLPTAGRARIGGANAMTGSVEADRNMGWNHTTSWYTFQITTAGGYTISMDRQSTDTNNQPAFSVWTSGTQAYRNEAGSHKFNQVIAPISITPDVLNGNGGHSDNGNDYMLVDDVNNNGSLNSNTPAPITGFVGYANSGATYVNAGGNNVLGALAQGTSVEGTKVGTTYQSIVTKGAFINANAGAISAPYAGVGASVNTSDPTLANANGGGHADLQLWLNPGWYVFTGGGSCADFTCTPTAVTTSVYTVKILANAGVTAPAAVPVPAAVWLFGSAIAGFGAIRRRKTA